MLSNQEKQTTLFQSSDMGLCVALICRNHKLESLDKTNPKKVLFQFVNSDSLQQDVFHYWKKELLIEPQEFMNQTKNLKGYLYGN